MSQCECATKYEWTSEMVTLEHHPMCDRADTARLEPTVYPPPQDNSYLIKSVRVASESETRIIYERTPGDPDFTVAHITTMPLYDRKDDDQTHIDAYLKRRLIYETGQPLNDPISGKLPPIIFCRPTSETNVEVFRYEPGIVIPAPEPERACSECGHLRARTEADCPTLEGLANLIDSLFVPQPEPLSPGGWPDSRTLALAVAVPYFYEDNEGVVITWLASYLWNRFQSTFGLPTGRRIWWGERPNVHVYADQESRSIKRALFLDATIEGLTPDEEASLDCILPEMESVRFEPFDRLAVLLTRK